MAPCPARSSHQKIHSISERTNRELLNGHPGTLLGTTLLHLPETIYYINNIWERILWTWKNMLANFDHFKPNVRIRIQEFQLSSNSSSQISFYIIYSPLHLSHWLFNIIHVPHKINNFLNNRLQLHWTYPRSFSLFLLIGCWLTELCLTAVTTFQL